jgi:hypothetical protein
MGAVLNTGDAELNLRVRESDDNNVTDKYAGELAVGTITFDGGNNPTDTEQIFIDDGITALTFEFDVPDGITGDVAVTIGGSAAATLANLKAAIEGTALDVTVTDTTGSGDPQLTITVNSPGRDNSNNNITNTGVNITTTGLAGGSDPNETVTIRVDGADVNPAVLTVTPGGIGVFVIEAAITVKRYLRFDVDEEAARGQLVLTHFADEWTRRERPDVP